jgi:hypothetical protein
MEKDSDPETCSIHTGDTDINSPLKLESGHDHAAAGEPSPTMSQYNNIESTPYSIPNLAGISEQGPNARLGNRDIADSVPHIADDLFICEGPDTRPERRETTVIVSKKLQVAVELCWQSTGWWHVTCLQSGLSRLVLSHGDTREPVNMGRTYAPHLVRTCMAWDASDACTTKLVDCDSRAIAWLAVCPKSAQRDVLRNATAEFVLPQFGRFETTSVREGIQALWESADDVASSIPAEAHAAHKARSRGMHQRSPPFEVLMAFVSKEMANVGNQSQSYMQWETVHQFLMAVWHHTLNSTHDSIAEELLQLTGMEPQQYLDDFVMENQAPFHFMQEHDTALREIARLSHVQLYPLEALERGRVAAKELLRLWEQEDGWFLIEGVEALWKGERANTAVGLVCMLV